MQKKKKLIFRFSCKKREQHKYLQEYKLEIKEKFVFLSLRNKGKVCIFNIFKLRVFRETY